MGRAQLMLLGGDNEEFWSSAGMFIIGLPAAILLILLITALIGLFTPAHGQEVEQIAPGPATPHAGHEEDLELHQKFYKTWMRPDEPTLSCCSNFDCYPTPARRVGNHWEALHRESQEWVRIPEEKVEHNRDMPDAQAHLCASQYKTIYCFGAGGGS